MATIDLFAQRENPIIIAEIGAKYAPMSVMKDMVLKSQESGADLVKFQTYTANTIATEGSHFTMEDGSTISQMDFFRIHELTVDDHNELDLYCKSIGIQWISTPSHETDLDLLEKFSPIAYKTGSDDLTNIPFLRKIAEKKRPMILSTGMCTLSEIERSVETVVRSGLDKIILLHCVVSYPSRPEDANLKVITTLQKAFGLPVGLSDHTQDELTSILATQMGAVIIEKHFTLDHAMKLPDHEASLDPAQFKILTERVKMVRRAMGTGVKSILPTEEKWRNAARKSIFAKRDVKRGEVLRDSDLEIRRPAAGLHPHYFDLILGKTAAADIESGTMLDFSMISFK
jgi:N,N'-diacetyllegionaminate synthase